METNLSQRACETCRQRRVKCDKSLPGCQRCENLGRPCSGYKPARKFLDESTKVIQKYSSESPSVSGSYTSRSHLQASPERRALIQTSPLPTTDEENQLSRENAVHNSSVYSMGSSPSSRADGPKTPYPGRTSKPVSARLIGNETISTHGTSESLATTGRSFSDDDFFDLDIETYYANGNNACGLIPGAPVILSNDAGFHLDEPTMEGYESSGLGEEEHQEHLGRLPLPRRTKEVAILLRHFVDVIAPSMDMFDSDAYFGRHFAYRAKQNSMLHAAIAAVAAKQIAQKVESRTHEATAQSESPGSSGFDEAQDFDWYYRAADYYDAGISHLRLHLERCCNVSPLSSPTSNTFAAFTSIPDDCSADLDTRGEPPNKRCRTSSHSHSLDCSNMEDLLSAIAVFSLYESLNGYSEGWKQHVAGFHSLLKNNILPHPSASSNNYLASIRGGRASFWNIARADFLAAYEHKSRTQMDPEDVALWKAAGLGLVTEKSLTSSTQITTMMAIDGREDDVCRSLLWILAKVMNFLGCKVATRTDDQCLETWNELRDCLHYWHKDLPVVFQPYASIPANEKTSNPSSRNAKPRFTQIFFSMPMCAAAMQLYHFAHILLLMNYPMEKNMDGANRLRMFRKVSQESEHHSRQICGIALGLRKISLVGDHMAHPLYMAGACLEVDDDRFIVIKLLKDIQKETGYSMAERVQGLLSIWGWPSSRYNNSSGQ